MNDKSEECSFLVVFLCRWTFSLILFENIQRKNVETETKKSILSTAAKIVRQQSEMRKLNLLGRKLFSNSLFDETEEFSIYEIEQISSMRFSFSCVSILSRNTNGVIHKRRPVKIDNFRLPLSRYPVVTEPSPLRTFGYRLRAPLQKPISVLRTFKWDEIWKICCRWSDKSMVKGNVSNYGVSGPKNLNLSILSWESAFILDYFSQVYFLLCH